MSSSFPPFFRVELTNILTRALGGNRTHNVIKLLARIGIDNIHDLAALPVKGNEDDLKTAINTLFHEGVMFPPDSSDETLDAYDRVNRVCCIETMVNPPSNASATVPIPCSALVPAGPAPSALTRPSYIRRSVFLGLAPQAAPSVALAPSAKRARPTISRSDDRADPFWVATQFAEGSSTLQLCRGGLVFVQWRAIVCPYSFGE